MQTVKNIKTVTGSRYVDVSIAAGITALMLLLAPRLRVYYQVTLVDVSIERVMADGSRSTVATPDEFKHVGKGYWPGETLVKRLQPKINDYMSGSGLAATAAPGAHFEWTIRWSDDSLAMDHADRIVWEKR